MFTSDPSSEDLFALFNETNRHTDEAPNPQPDESLEQASSHNPKNPSATAARQLPPAFPKRAAWGTASKLRAWQAAALERYELLQPKDFLTVATPGAGKTTFALQIAAKLLEEKRVRRITVVTPTEHLKTQWADAALRVGINIDPKFTNAQGRHASQYQGVALTYAQVGANPRLHRARTEAAPTLVILDEIHHAGDALTWGEAVKEAFDPAQRRLALTGTPFRSDDAQIPFVNYETDSDGFLRSKADYSYGYANALRDHVVRPVLFLTYSGRMQWRTKAGDEISAQLGANETKDITQQAWRTALDPKGDWIKVVLKAADKRLSEVRRQVADAGGLVIASDQTHAREYAKLLKSITGQSPTLVLSDDAAAGRKIESFANNNDRWMVAVRMVSEGVDVPRLAVGVYATSTSTPMFFAQAVGRFVRLRTRGEIASIFVPSVPTLLALANELEIQRDHVLEPVGNIEVQDIGELEADLMKAANREEKASSDLLGFEALGSDAHFDRVLFDGDEYGFKALAGSAEEEEYLGIPGLLEPDQVAALLKKHQQATTEKNKAANQLDSHRNITQLRKELASLVSGWAHRTGTPHGQVHSELRRRTGGPAVPQASSSQIQARIDILRGWFVGKK